jgi:hypothetical protein
MPILPTNIASTYDDDPLDPSVQLHQQHHDALHGQNNLYEVYGVVVVNHGSNASTPRPTGAARVLWVGSVTPLAALDGDLGAGWDVSVGPVSAGPAAGKIGLYMDGLDLAHVTSYETWIGHGIGVVLRYTAGNDLPWGGAITGHRSMWSPAWTYSTPDSVITAFCNNLVASGQADTILRPMWESNGPWMGNWFGPGNETAWIARWRHVVDVCRAAAGNSFQFEWNVNVSEETPTGALGGGHVMNWYPGDSYVDYIGMDAYSHYPNNNNWATCPTGFNWLKATAAAHGKSYGFSEFGVTNTDNVTYMNIILPFIADASCAYGIYFESNPADGSHAMMGGQFPQSAAALKAFG